MYYLWLNHTAKHWCKHTYQLTHTQFSTEGWDEEALHTANVNWIIKGTFRTCSSTMVGEQVIFSSLVSDGILSQISDIQQQNQKSFKREILWSAGPVSCSSPPFRKSSVAYMKSKAFRREGNLERKSFYSQNSKLIQGNFLSRNW